MIQRQGPSKNLSFDWLKPVIEIPCYEDYFETLNCFINKVITSSCTCILTLLFMGSFWTKSNTNETSNSIQDKKKLNQQFELNQTIKVYRYKMCLIPFSIPFCLYTSILRLSTYWLIDVSSWKLEELNGVCVNTYV